MKSEVAVSMTLLETGGMKSGEIGYIAQTGLGCMNFEAIGSTTKLATGWVRTINRNDSFHRGGRIR